MNDNSQFGLLDPRINGVVVVVAVGSNNNGNNNDNNNGINVVIVIVMIIVIILIMILVIFQNILNQYHIKITTIRTTTANIAHIFMSFHQYFLFNLPACCSNCDAPC